MIWKTLIMFVKGSITMKMNEWIDISLLIIGMCSAFVLGTLVSSKWITILEKTIDYQLDDYFDKTTNLLYENLNHEKNNNLTFNLIAKNLVEEHDYSKPDYVCHHFSKELTHRLQDAGYDACYVMGTLDDDNETYHAWTELTIGIESTSGTFIDPIDYKKRYKELKRDCE